MGFSSSGNFDTGEYKCSFDDETVISVKLDELNQHHQSFQPMLNGILSRAFQRAYEQGKEKTVRLAMNALRDI